MQSMAREKCSLRSVNTLLFTVFVFSVWPGSSSAQTWVPVQDDESLRSLFSDTEMSARLRDGAQATAVYNSDGTGELRAWNATFPRKWKIEDGKACLSIDQQWVCFEIERNSEKEDEYRGKRSDTGEQIVFEVRGAELSMGQVPAGGQGGAVAPSADEIAKELANPNTPLATLTLRTRYQGFEGDLPDADNQNSTTFLLQPTFPFPTQGGGTLFFRPAIPVVVNKPVPEAGGFGGESGLGDISFDLGYGKTNKETGLLLAGGVVSTLPTATSDDLGADRFTIGPEVLVGLLRPNYVLGAFPNHQWSVAGSGNADINLTTVQLFGIFLPGNAWSVGTAPIISYDWENEQWTTPLNLDVGKTVIINGRPWKFGLGLNYYIDKPDSIGPKWMIEFSVGPVVENVIAKWFD